MTAGRAAPLHVLCGLSARWPDATNLWIEHFTPVCYALTLSLLQRKLLPHQPPLWIYPNSAVFFITICCLPPGLNQLCKPAIAPALFDSVEFRQQRGDWWVQLWLLMPDHLHGLVVFPSDKEMAQVIPQWKELTAKRLGICWQRNFFDHRLRQEESWRAKADYILQNPVRRGFVKKAEDWPYVWMPKISDSVSPVV